MKKLCCAFVMLCALFPLPSVADEIRLSIGVNLSEYPEFEVIPGYPVYYAPRLRANYFFYDGDYWLYQDDNWYESEWYDGPWRLVEPDNVPLFILRIPVGFYLLPPAYFFSWQSDEPPHWGEYWGHEWEVHRRGWDHWNRRIHRKPAPLPLYQREYAGDRYPNQFQEQRELRRKHYHYRSRDPLVRKRQHQRSSEIPATRRERATPGSNNAVPHQREQRVTPSRRKESYGNGTPQRDAGMERRDERRERDSDRGRGR